MTVRVLFVCLGNICRSPTAHGVFQQRVNELGLQQQIDVDSAGTAGWHEGRSPDPRSIEAAAKQGYDLTELRASQVQQQDFQRYDYVLAMDASNLADLQQLCPPDYRGELTLFLRYGTDLDGLPNTADSLQVPDPYYGDGDGFLQVIQLIEQASDGLLRRLISTHALQA
jgi:protein-tyrosine phosphatase